MVVSRTKPDQKREPKARNGGSKKNDRKIKRANIWCPTLYFSRRLHVDTTINWWTIIGRYFKIKRIFMGDLHISYRLIDWILIWSSLISIFQFINFTVALWQILNIRNSLTRDFNISCIDIKYISKLSIPV